MSEARPLAEVVAELRRLEREATPGPWRMVQENIPGPGSTADKVNWVVDPGRFYVASTPDMPPVVQDVWSGDASMIVAARNALPALLDAIDAAGTVPVQFSALAGEVDVRVEGRKLDADEYTVKDGVVTMCAPPAQIARRDRLLSRALAAMAEQRRSWCDEFCDPPFHGNRCSLASAAIAELRAAGVEPEG